MLEESDYGGIFVCTSCNGSFFVSLTGEPLQPAPAENPAADQQPQFQNLLVDELQEFSVPASEHEVAFDNITGQPSLEPDIAVSFHSEGESEFSENLFPNPQHEPMSEANENSKVPQVTTTSFPSLSGAADLGVMNSFANSGDVSIPLSYDLVISGVDTEPELEILVEALTDQRLGLDRRAIVDNMQNGQARVTDLNPVKAAILFQRLRYEAFSIEVIEKKI